MPQKPQNFWQELKRRKVFRVISVYVAAAFGILEVVDIIAEPLRLPFWLLPVVIVLLSIGFIIAIILSWIYDIHPEGGIVKTGPAHKIQDKTISKSSSGWKIATYISFIVIVGLIVLNIISRGGREEILEKSIAVLPFDNMSVGEDYAHMGDAITDEIILELQKVHEFDRVLSRSSTMQFKINRPTLPEIAEKLGVNYLIEGAVQRHEDNVSIRVQVIRAKQEDHIWADEFDGKWGEIFSLQDEIAFEVAHELKAVLTPEEIEEIEKNPTENTEAYNLFLRGRFFWNQRTEEALRRAIHYFEQAVQIDSNYALAYIGLADSYSMLPWYSNTPDPENFKQAEEAALRALEIDNSLVEAHASIGYVYYNKWELKAAEKEYLKAIELDSSYSSVHHWYAMLLNSMGRYNEAIAEILKAHKIDPLSLVVHRNVGVTYLYARQYDMAIEVLEEVAEIDPEFPHLQNFLARSYFYNEMYDKALTAIQTCENDSRIWEGIIYARLGELDNAKQILDKYLLLSKETYVSPVWLALLLFSFDRDEEGFRQLEHDYEIHNLGLINIKTYPEFDQFRSDPRYINLLDKIGLPVD